eukprot:15476024-Alexandrium_andersonii.AAC.1
MPRTAAIFQVSGNSEYEGSDLASSISASCRSSILCATSIVVLACVGLTTFCLSSRNPMVSA